jgi:hypothetical protein
MNYSDPFAIQENTPLSRALRTIELQDNQQLNWPDGYTGPDFIAAINLINTYEDNLMLMMPSAFGANMGTGMLFINIGDKTALIGNIGGFQITSVRAGEAKYLYCADNTYEAGDWRSIVFGQGTSEADAVQLAGNGVTAIGGKLHAAHQVTLTASDVNVTPGDRAKVFAASDGSVTLNLPSYTVVGNSFFFGANNAGSGTLKLKAPNGSTIDGYTSLSLAPNESVFVFCSGTSKWYTIGYGRSTQFQFTKLVKDVSPAGNIVLTSAEASNKLLQFIGNPAADVIVIVPSVVGIYYVQCSYGGSSALTIKTLNGAGVSLGSSDRVILYCDGTDVVSAQSVAVGTNLAIVDGSLNSPAISFSADPNTGLYRADVETLGLASNGVESARFNYLYSAITGKLGVGLVNPAVQLHVKAGQAEALRLQGTGAYMTFYNTVGDTRSGYIAGDDLLLKDFVDGKGERQFFINGVKRLTVNETGIVVNGSIQSSSEPYATLSANTFTGIQTVPVQRFKVLSLGNVSGPVQIDLAVASTFTATITAATTFSFKNAPPAGFDQTVYLKLTNASVGAAFIAGTQFPNNGTPPAYSTNGRDLLAVWYDVEQQTYVVGTVWKGYK